MKNICITDLKNIKENHNLKSSEATLFNCEFNNNFFIYKQLKSFSQIKLKRFKELMKVNNYLLNLPIYIVYSNNNPKGYLLEYLNKYEVISKLPHYYEKEKIINILKITKEKIIQMHKLGIIHCDLHPGNIMFKDNDIKFIDFDNCFYKRINPEPNTNFYLNRNYLKYNILNYSLDIFTFNLTCLSIIYNVDLDYILSKTYSDMIEEKIQTSKQYEIWQKTKQKKELTYNDFFIDYC